MDRRIRRRIRWKSIETDALLLVAAPKELVVMPQPELHRRKSRAVAALRNVVQRSSVVHDARKRFELGRGQGGLIHDVDQCVEMLVARHGDVPAKAIMDAAESYLVEAIDVDHEVEWLPDREEIVEHQQLLRLFVALMAEAQRHQLAIAHRVVPPQGLLEPGGAEPAEVRADRTSEDADDELPIAGFRKRIVEARGESKVVGRDNFVGLAAAQFRRQIKRNPGSMRRAEIRMQANRGQRVAAALFLDQPDRRPIGIEIKQPAV